MNQLIIFSVSALLCAIPLVLFNNYYLRRTFLAYVGLVMIILVCMISIMTYCIAVLGIHHLIWALPLSACFVVISLSKIFKKVRNPIFEIYNTLEALASGDVEMEIDERMKAQRNEIGKVYRSLDNYVRKQKAVAAFATEVGAGNLQVQYEVSSDRDKIGLALVKMRSNLENFIGSTKDVVKTASQEGNLDVRIATENQEGAWKDLGFALNDLLNSFSTPLINLNDIISSMAQGDMTQRYTAPAKGDILKMTQTLNVALDNIDGLLAMVSDNVRVIDDSSREMKSSSEEMSASTQEIATSIAEMSNGAQMQVTKVDESSRLIEGILSSSHSMGTKAENINQTAVQGEKISEKGLKLMNGMVDDMGQISFYAKSANESIQVLKDRSAQISKALSVISEIASQTNLLALNAAIEAAQAGDAGRGFSVVAEEIRKLAEGSKRSANEIGSLVQDVQSDTLVAAKSMSEMVTCVNRGENTSQETSVAFNQILASSSETLKLSEEILSATREQITDINEVVVITEKIVVIAEETAAGTEEVASSATELSTGMEGYNQRAQNLAQMAVSFRDAISQLKLSGKNAKESAVGQVGELSTTNGHTE